MQNKNYNLKTTVDWLMENSSNDQKRKGSKPTTPKEDGISTDIKSISITHDVDGMVYGVSFHEMPTRFYTFVLPDEMYEDFLWFQVNYPYARTPKKKVVSKSKFANAFSENKTDYKSLLQDIN